MAVSEVYSPGLEGVIAGETAISTVEGGLRYRGYPVTQLAEKTSFEEVAYLLLHGDLPANSQLSAFAADLEAARSIPAALEKLLACRGPDRSPRAIPTHLLAGACSECLELDARGGHRLEVRRN